MAKRETTRQRKKTIGNLFREKFEKAGPAESLEMVALLGLGVGQFGASMNGNPMRYPNLVGQAVGSAVSAPFVAIVEALGVAAGKVAVGSLKELIPNFRLGLPLGGIGSVVSGSMPFGSATAQYYGSGQQGWLPDNPADYGAGAQVGGEYYAGSGESYSPPGRSSGPDLSFAMTREEFFKYLTAFGDASAVLWAMLQIPKVAKATGRVALKIYEEGLPGETV